MKVLLAYNDYDSVSGETIFFNNMKKALKNKGFEVRCCAIAQMPQYTLPGAVDCYLRFPMLLNTYRELKKYRDYDVIHFLNASLSPAGMLLGNKIKIATSHFLAGSYHDLSPPGNPFVNISESIYCRYAENLDRPAFRNLDCLIACTDYHAREIKDRYSIDEKKVRVIPPGVDLDHHMKAEPLDLRANYDCEEVILYLGRHHERSKGVSYLIRAMNHLKRDAKLLILGDGPDKGYYENLVARLGLKERIVFLGRQDNDAKSRIQKSADVVVMPSLFEVFGTVFAESLACRVPVVAFDLPFWKGVYDGAGLFVRKDPVSLAEGIDRVLEDESLRKSMISCGTKYAEEYDIKRTVSRYIAMYRELAE
jgi:glycosyltransferase involved in cell wall biosynthesis